MLSCLFASVRTGGAQSRENDAESKVTGENVSLSGVSVSCRCHVRDVTTRVYHVPISDINLRQRHALAQQEPHYYR